MKISWKIFTKKVFTMFLFQGSVFTINDFQKFDQAIKLLYESVSPNSFFYSDNVITWARNFSFLEDRHFMRVIDRNAETNIEKGIIWRSYVLCYFANIAKQLEGDFVEIGTYKGTTANIILDFCQLNRRKEKNNRQYFLYDTFEHNDSDLNHSLPEHSPKLYEQVKNRFAKYDFVKVIKGYVPESFSQGFPENKIAFAHIDLNQAPAEVAALEAVLPKLSPNGIVVMDDYGWLKYRKQKVAEDPVFEKFGMSVLELPTGQGIAIKPNQK